jgi:endoglucanase
LRNIRTLYALVFALTACSDGTGPESRPVPVDAVFSRISGGGGLVPGGCELSEPLAVKVTASNGTPIAGASVEFAVTSGGGAVAPEVVQTNTQGEAAAEWKLGRAGGANTVRALLRNSSQAPITFVAEAVPTAPDGFATIGNTIYNAQCQPHRFHGIARPALEWSATGDERFAKIAEDFALIRSWRADVVRIPINQSFWLSGTRQHDAGYRGRVTQAVTAARKVGLAVIIDLHVSDRGNPNYDTIPDAQQMPDLRHSLPFWRDVAQTFKDDGGVIFELYNEPHEVTWDMWLNGGLVPAGPKYPGGPWGEAYQAVGMQQLYDAVRSMGARNLVILSGTHWGFFLDGVPTHRVKGYNIAYGSHPYDWPDKQPDTWERAFGFLAETDPVIITEFGAYDCDRLSFYQAAMDYADRKGISWVAWAWWTPPPVGPSHSAAERSEKLCRFPALIADWNGTPTQSGSLIRQRLASY